MQTKDYYARVQSIFETMLLPDTELRQQVDALQALLFLSMLPLHVDKPRRQLAMLTTWLGAIRSKLEIRSGGMTVLITMAGLRFSLQGEGIPCRQSSASWPAVAP